MALNENENENHDGMISDVTSAMEDIQIPDHDMGDSTTSTSPPTASSHPALITPDPARRRPLDDIAQAGPHANPIDFPRPTFERGRRDNVLCYNEQTGSHDVFQGVLFRDYSREFGDEDGALHRVKQAYWPLPYKEVITTIMGHVEICIVLTRCIQEADDDSNSSDDDEDEADQDIVFQVTTKIVAVKVNYCDRMERLRAKHAEDPLKEIAAMELIGNSHPNVMGTIEVLFDGTNLNVVMPYCRSGDMFELLQETQTAHPDVPGLSEPTARYWFRQVLDGVQFLHSKGICHRDLSPENVMIDGNGALIIDMGMCLRVPYSDLNNPEQATDITNGSMRRLILPQGACGKLPYMSPEIYRNHSSFDAGAVDVWTAGTILFCMISGNRSYQRPHESDPQFYWMTHGLARLISDWGVKVSDECLHLLQNMLQIDPRLRLTLDECIHHPWFAHPDEPPPRADPHRAHTW